MACKPHVSCCNRNISRNAHAVENVFDDGDVQFRESGSIHRHVSDNVEYFLPLLEMLRLGVGFFEGSYNLWKRLSRLRNHNIAQLRVVMSIYRNGNLLTTILCSDNIPVVHPFFGVTYII